jgi:hypothetical protein
MRRLVTMETVDDLEFVDDETPQGAQRILEIPEPGSVNVGPTGAYPRGDYPRSDQDLRVKILRSGTFGQNIFGNAALFGFKFNSGPYDESLNEVMDDQIGYMGGQAPYYYNVSQVVVSNQTNKLGPAKLLPLTHSSYGDYSVDGAASLLIYPEWQVGLSTWYINSKILAMNEYGSNPPGMRYVNESSTVENIGSAVTPVCYADAVEMDDGTLGMAVAQDDDFFFYRCYDKSAIQTSSNWKLAEENATWAGVDTFEYIAVDRIGSRLVVAYGLTTAAKVYTRYSDDGGVTWSSANDTGHATVGKVDFYRAVNGKLYLQIASAAGIYMYPTADGENWESAVQINNLNSVAGSLYQEVNGRWVMWMNALYGSRPNWIRDVDEPLDHANPGWYSQEGAIDYPMSDYTNWDVVGGGMCARSILNDNFTDVAVTYLYSNVSDYYSIVVYRCAMWTGIQYDLYNVDWGAADDQEWRWRCWEAVGYPSSADVEPKMGGATYDWSKTSAGAGAATLTSAGTNSDGELKTYSTNDADTIYYSKNRDTFYNDAASDPTIDECITTGMKIFFQVKVVDGAASVVGSFSGNSGGNYSKEVGFRITFTETQIFAYDSILDDALFNDVTPTNWNPADWNSYLIVVGPRGSGAADRMRFELYRAPTGAYTDCLPLELVGEGDLDEAAYTADNWELSFGYHGHLVGIGATDARWHFFNYSGHGYENDWTDSDVRGKFCTSDLTGLLQGIHMRFTGGYLVEDDYWDVETSSIYRAQNIFVSSPAIYWKDPGTLTGARTITWRREQVISADMNYVFDAFAIFGKNFLKFKLEGDDDYSGGSKTTLIDSSAGNAAPWLGRYKIKTGTIDNNVFGLQTDGATPVDIDPLIPGQFASTPYRKYYVYVDTGTAADEIFTILGNTEDRLIVDINASVDLSAGDALRVFSDRCLYVFSSLQQYPRLTLTIPDQTVPDPFSPRQYKIGTIVFGRTFPLSDDEWESAITSESGVEVIEGRSGIRQARLSKQDRRSITLVYTGQIDAGMGVSPPHEVAERCGFGLYPVAWIDDDSLMSQNSDLLHCEPILARLVGNPTQLRRAYNREYVRIDDNASLDGYANRNILDVSDLTLEEIL